MKIKDLEIVGYADVLFDESLPTIVPPIYRNMKTNEYLLPPFNYWWDGVYNEHEVFGEIVSESKFKEYHTADKLSVLFHFLRPTTVYLDHEMWVDTGFNVHYEPRIVVIQKLKAISIECVRNGIIKFLENNFEDAIKLAQNAICANETNTESSLLKICSLLSLKKEDETRGIKKVLEAQLPKRKSE